MKMISASGPTRSFRRAFTLVELMCAMVVGLGLAGTVVLLLVQSATEQRSGFADTTVEEAAYILEANITTCLRCMSANQGVTPVWSSVVTDGSGNTLGYSTISVFSPSNGGYIQASISYNSSTGQVTYTPDITAPAAQIVWMTNSATAALSQLYFSTSFNPDGSPDGSLVNVAIEMNDNGFSQQGTVNNPTSIFRDFSVQMRNDN
jgi:prepilin-type N-terminal cleavage/methylation domain-containing protein